MLYIVLFSFFILFYNLLIKVALETKQKGNQFKNNVKDKFNPLRSRAMHVIQGKGKIPKGYNGGEYIDYKEL